MKNIIKNVITKGTYELGKMLKSIESAYIEGKLTEEEVNELATLARERANSQNGIDILVKLEELDRRIRSLEEKATTSEGIENYPEYTVGKWYYNGDKVSFEGVNYTCTAPEGTVCVWSPAEYPAYWEALT